MGISTSFADVDRETEVSKLAVSEVKLQQASSSELGSAALIEPLMCRSRYALCCSLWSDKDSFIQKCSPFFTSGRGRWDFIFELVAPKKDSHHFVTKNNSFIYTPKTEPFIFIWYTCCSMFLHVVAAFCATQKLWSPSCHEGCSSQKWHTDG